MNNNNNNNKQKIRNSINLKYILIPVLVFLLIDTIIIHERVGILKLHIPILSKVLNFIYNLLSKLIYNKYHSQTFAHTIIFSIITYFLYFLVDNYNINLLNKYNFSL